MPTPVFHLTTPQPHPTKYTHTGIGGAGNYRRTPSTPTTPTSTTRSPLTHTVSAPKSFTLGRGGAGNVRTYSERAIFSFDEELEHLTRAEATFAPVYHVGRGGAGNAVDERRRGSVSSGDSGGSTGSTARRSVDWMRERMSIGRVSMASDRDGRRG